PTSGGNSLSSLMSCSWEIMLRLRKSLRHQERPRLREHPGLGVGIPPLDRRRLPLDFRRDFLQPALEGQLVPLELLPLRLIEQGQLHDLRLVQFFLDGPLQLGEDRPDVVRFLALTLGQFLLQPRRAVLGAGLERLGQRRCQLRVTRPPPGPPRGRPPLPRPRGPPPPRPPHPSSGRPSPPPRGGRCPPPPP